MIMTAGAVVVLILYFFDWVWPDPNPPTFEPYEFPEDREF